MDGCKFEGHFWVGKPVKIRFNGNVNGKWQKCTIIVDSRSYMPIRFVLEPLGYSVAWSTYAKAVIITKQGQVAGGATSLGNHTVMGTGMEQDPLQITSAEQLAEIAALVNKGKLEETVLGERVPNTVHIKLMNDIDLSAYSEGSGWTPIGIYAEPDESKQLVFIDQDYIYYDSMNERHFLWDYTQDTYQKIMKFAFKGVFDGNGKTISGLVINAPATSGRGLFGAVFNGTVKNLAVENADVVGGSYVGIVVGYMAYANITNSHSTGKVHCVWKQEDEKSNYGLYGGGLAGQVSHSNVERCYSEASVSGGKEMGGTVGRGGLVGSVTNVSRVANCYATGAVSVDIGPGTGGLVGEVNNFSNVENCYATGTVTGFDGVGGIVGALDIGCDIKNCAALNPIVNAGRSNRTIGRVAGKINYPHTNVLFNNAAFINMTDGGDDGLDIVITFLGETTGDGRDGTDIGIAEIMTDGTLGGRFTAADGWTTENGKLPGFGRTVELPGHLR